MELVSIIIPTFNVEKYISECIKSALDQNHDNTEIIIVDNNSTDMTVSIIQELRNKFPDKIIFTIESNQGAGFARNKGLCLASGNWIQFLDADDLLHADKIESDLIFLKDADKNVAFLAGSWRKFNLNSAYKDIEIDKVDLIKAIFRGQNCGNTVANLWNRQALVSVGGFCLLRDTHDPDLMLRLILDNWKYLLSENIGCTIRSRIEPTQLSNSDLKGHYERHFWLRLNSYKKLNYINPIYTLANKDYFYTCIYSFAKKVALFDSDLRLHLYLNVVNSNAKLIFIHGLLISKKIIWMHKILGSKRANQIYTNYIKLRYGN